MKVMTKSASMVATIAFAGLLSEAGMSLQRERSAGSSSADTWGEVTQGFQLSANLEETVVLRAKPIVMNLKLRNTTKETLIVVETGPMRDYKATVLNAAGELVQPTEYGKKWQSHSGDYQQFSVWNIDLSK